MTNFLFGDPCRYCGAASDAADERDRVCTCEPCATCGVSTNHMCGYCGRSLGCKAHKIHIDRHVQTFCLATDEERTGADSKRDWPLLQAIVRQRPRPWPDPIGPFGELASQFAAREPEQGR